MGSPRGGPIPWQLAKPRGHRAGRSAAVPARPLTGYATLPQAAGGKTSGGKTSRGKGRVQSNKTAGALRNASGAVARLTQKVGRRPTKVGVQQLVKATKKLNKAAARVVRAVRQEPILPAAKAEVVEAVKVAEKTLRQATQVVAQADKEVEEQKNGTEFSLPPPGVEVVDDDAVDDDAVAAVDTYVDVSEDFDGQELDEQSGNSGGESGGAASGGNDYHFSPDEGYAAEGDADEALLFEDDDLIFDDADVLTEESAQTVDEGPQPGVLSWIKANPGKTALAAGVLWWLFLRKHPPIDETAL